MDHCRIPLGVSPYKYTDSVEYRPLQGFLTTPPPSTPRMCSSRKYHCGVTLDGWSSIQLPTRRILAVSKMEKLDLPIGCAFPLPAGVSIALQGAFGLAMLP